MLVLEQYFPQLCFKKLPWHSFRISFIYLSCVFEDEHIILSPILMFLQFSVFKSQNDGVFPRTHKKTTTDICKIIVIKGTWQAKVG